MVRWQSQSSICGWNKSQAGIRSIRMLNAYGLVLVDDPVTHIWQVKNADEPAYHHLDVSLLGLDANNPATLTNDSVPLIEFGDVPLYKALEALIRQAALPMALDPRFRDGHEAVGQTWLSLRWKTPPQNRPSSRFARIIIWTS